MSQCREGRAARSMSKVTAGRCPGCGGRLESVDPVLIVFAAVLVGACVALIALLISQRRTQHQVAAFMGRLDELERSLPVWKDNDDLAPGEESPDVDQKSLIAGQRNLSRDVLAGRTSFVRRAVEGEVDRPASLAAQAIVLVCSKIEESVSPAELADDLAISLRTLERGLAGELGCTPRQLISALKMREARRMLESGHYRVNEVATKLGFATASHFSRSFRTFYRTPPSSFVRPGAR